MTIEEIKQINIVDYLYHKGIKPTKQYHNTYWYLSPLHEETNSSFKVDMNTNLWYDFALAQGGNIINLVQAMNPLLDNNGIICHLKSYSNNDDNQSFIPVPDREALIRNNKVKNDNTIIDRIVDISNANLINYLVGRTISIDVAKEYCKEVYYTISSNKTYYGIGFNNNSDGMEIRNQFFKRCIGKKDITHIAKERELPVRQCCVFEGFFDFLSYKTCKERGDRWLCVDGVCDYLVLNSVAMVNKAIPCLERYDKLFLYLDNDDAGKSATRTIIERYGSKAKDCRERYAKFSDVNDFITGKTKV